MMKTMWVITCLLSSLFLSDWAAAQGRQSPKKAKSQPAAALQEAKDGANHALNELDRGLHQAARGAKSGANKALQSVDDAVHGRKK